MYRPSVFLKAMRDQRWLVLGFGLGCALMAAFVLSVYPSYGESLADVDISPALTAIFGDIDLGSAEGFITAEFFSWVPILLVVYAIIQGTGVLAGEESNGTLDLLLAQPVTRIRLFIEKSMSLVVGTLMIIALTLPGWLIPYAAADINVDLGRLLRATVVMAPLTLAFAGLSLMAGCLLPTRRNAATVLPRSGRRRVGAATTGLPLLLLRRRRCPHYGNRLGGRGRAARHRGGGQRYRSRAVPAARHRGRPDAKRLWPSHAPAASEPLRTGAGGPGYRRASLERVYPAPAMRARWPSLERQT